MRRPLVYVVGTYPSRLPETVLALPQNLRWSAVESELACITDIVPADISVTVSNRPNQGNNLKPANYRARFVWREFDLVTFDGLTQRLPSPSVTRCRER